MKGMEFLEKLEQIDPAYLAEAEQAPVQKRRRLPRWGVALAACLALLVSAGAALAISGYGIRVLGSFDTLAADGYTPKTRYVIEVDAQQFPLSAFTGEVLDVKTELIAQYEQWLEEMTDAHTEALTELLEEDPERRLFTGSCRRDFDTAQEAWDYIGFAGLKKTDMGLEEEKAWSAAIGNSSGQLESVSFCVVYTADELHLMTSALIFTEYEDVSEGGIVLYSLTDVDSDYDLYTTAAGRQCRIFCRDAGEDGCLRTYSELIADGILYSVFITHPAEDADQALELLHLWADQL